MQVYKLFNMVKNTLAMGGGGRGGEQKHANGA